MQTRNRLVAAVVAAVALTGAAHAQNVVAQWIQLGPGSSAAALHSGSYGDQPLSTTPTILARAIINGGSCPSLTVDGTLPIAMTQRFAASQLTSLTNSRPVVINGVTTKYTNGAAGYPAYFVSASAASPANFPDGTAEATTGWAECEAIVPAGHTTATIGGVNLKLPIANPQRILVIGDTGCRMSGSAQQNCHDPVGFPFAALAAYEAQFKPDLIVQVGDYFYRDTNCVPTSTAGASNGGPAITAGVPFVAGCNVSTNPAFETWGDTFDSWNADFFYPGNTLLPTAPWVMARGNHESCGRGARGWFALLDPHPFNVNQVNCQGGAGAAVASTGPVYTGDFTPTYIVPMGNANLLMHDSSYALDGCVDTNMAANYDYDMTAVLNTLPALSNNIYVTHKPTFGLVAASAATAPCNVAGGPFNGGDFTEQFAYGGNATNSNSAFTGGVPAKIGMFLSGHIHQFEYVNFNDYVHYAPQLIVGTSGDNIDPTANPAGDSAYLTQSPALLYAYQSQSFDVHNTASATFAPVTTTVHAAYSQAEFGFALLQTTATGYIANVYNIYAVKAGRCTITLSNPGPRNIACWD
jgi:hypothetical protein